ncbi:RsmB/NOP family class I SAM-dependent RNA methyltransferase [Pseudoprimorskyibacter insulae]|uniref:Ribosomal RNA small subunit methyltransferase B n=1 Tax=Pseudoprimorskyibacter insulae TaxID=1695997 RepID=A0A2R8B0E3_9RHOB|nr:RsmB/NOP family class I SAM-dependent RNA methyltransferase [Pseudoprimorskyibacter insulae]SPF81741.1 Ribosomal RNA small subunit methyltransferase B [Pseudoprimorskyibacter insulae]
MLTPAIQMQTALDLIQEVDRAARPADAIVSAFFRTHRKMEDADRGAIFGLLQDMLRHRARLGWWLARHGRSDTPRNRLLVWLTLGQGRGPDQIHRLFNGRKFAPEALSQNEHSLLIKLQGVALIHRDMPDEVRLECPDWALAPLQARFGDGFEAEMTAMLTPPTLGLRVNTLKATRKDMLRELANLGLSPEPSEVAPNGIRIRKRLSLTRLPALKSGALEVQDEGSQLVAGLVDAQPGDRVADFCAGAGGKTLAIAAQMQGKGLVVACDINQGRLKRCTERLRKAGAHNAQTQVLTSETDKWIKRRKGSFDRVLVDAPCSGTGTWRRNPDARWRPEEEQGLESLIALQARILASAARLVKPGGRLVYATCSLLPEENEGQIETFLAKTPGFKVVPLPQIAPDLRSCHEAYLSLTPAQHDTDGFFAAVLQRDLPEVKETPEDAE